MEVGDTIDTATLVPTASGSKYEGSFGRSFWTKGEEATYREADPTGATYRCQLDGQK
jgi:membrane-bound inhibitor of C-type lysozyme